MKISFTGTHGIGKTTLAIWLAEVLKIPYVPEFAREFLEKGYQIDTPRAFTSFETEILEKKMDLEINILKNSDSLVSDRSYLDYAVYLKHGLSRFPYDQIKNLQFKDMPITRYFNEYESLCRERNRIYDLIFFLTPFTEYISAEFDYREKNPFATNIIQDLLINEYKEEIRHEKVVLIKEKDLLERKKMIIHSLKERGFLSWSQLYVDEEL